MLIVNPNNRIRSPFAGVEPPLWAGLIAGYNGADILDAEGLNLSLDETEATIRNWGAEDDVLIVVMGNNPSVSSTPKMPIAEALAERLPDYNVALTGIHPQSAGSKYPVVSGLFSGYPHVPYVCLPMENYRAHNWQCLDGSDRSHYASIYTSLGCPFDCYYCNIHTLYSHRSVNLRPVADILSEVSILVRDYGVRNLKIWDELFAMNEDRVISICSGLEQFHLNIWAYARVGTVTPKMLKAMKRAGINWLAYGFESADMEVRDKSNKHYTNMAIERVIEGTRDAGISIIGNFMFGLPGDTPETMQKSLDYAKSHLFEYVNFYVAKPYPGSQWYTDIKVAYGPTQDWDYFNQYGSERMAFRDKAFHEYFTYPPYLEHIKKLYGEQAVGQIRDMLAWRI